MSIQEGTYLDSTLFLHLICLFLWAFYNSWDVVKWQLTHIGMFLYYQCDLLFINDNFFAWIEIQISSFVIKRVHGLNPRSCSTMKDGNSSRPLHVHCPLHTCAQHYMFSFKSTETKRYSNDRKLYIVWYFKILWGPSNIIVPNWLALPQSITFKILAWCWWVNKHSQLMEYFNHLMLHLSETENVNHRFKCYHGYSSFVGNVLAC